MIKKVLNVVRFIFLDNPLAIILFSVLAFFYLVTNVNLQPHVDTDFFFSSEDPQLKEEKRFSEVFPQPSQIILSAHGNLYSEEYNQRLSALTQELMLVDEVSGVKSIANGPGTYERALASPLWRRLLISEDGASSNIIVFLPPVSPKIIVPKIEKVVEDYSDKDFKLKIAGVPYVVELIRRYLWQDLQVFSLVAFITFSLAVIMIFRSFRVLLGTLFTCVDSCVLTLIAADFFKVKIGILTANISTIVFVLTLSHIVFLTNNWQRISREDPECDNRKAARTAVAQTIGASFWCMATTLLGFASLIFVQAKPLRELGASGVIGTLMAIATAYCVYPLFLSFGKRIKVASNVRLSGPRQVLAGHYMWATALLAMMVGFALPGLQRLNLDPSLLSYFKQNDILRDGMEYIDRNGGSSPLNIVVSDKHEALLNTAKAYHQLWQLQEAFEADPSVGSVISLPVLLAEGKRFPLSVFVSLENMLRIMGDKRFEAVSRTFITDDRKKARFFLRMKESARKVPRVEVIKRLEQIIKDNGFEMEMVGGIYKLQGEMSHIVVGSLIKGLIYLVALFVIIAFVVSNSVKITIAMAACIATIPIFMLGIFGHLNIPIDIISAPAANVVIGMAIDSMIHLVTAMRRFLDHGNGFWQAWKNARSVLWKPVISSMCLVAAGFGIFSFSMFPPSQRFGMAVVLGMLIAGPIALFVLPSVVGPWFYRD